MECVKVQNGKGHHKDEKCVNGKNGIQIRNPHIKKMAKDVLYHLALDTDNHDMEEMFGDVKFVCMGGTPKRMENFAKFMMNELDIKLPTGSQLYDITQLSHRYSMYKSGPVLCVNHGMGVPSLGILLHEMVKLMHYAKAKDPVFIRLGTCGGLGLEPGTVVVSDGAVDGLLRPIHEMHVLGKVVERPTILDVQLAKDIAAMTEPEDAFKTIIGTTMCSNDFYEGQGRLDGAICHYEEEDKMHFLQKLTAQGIVNIEMECTIFAALTHYTGIKAGIVCVTLLDRLKGDQVETPKEKLLHWQNRPQIITARYIKNVLKSCEA